MKKFALAAVAAFTAFTATAAQADMLSSRFSFTDKASGYEVTGKRFGSRLYLTGVQPASGKTFDVVVSASGRTTGTFEGSRVDFVVGQKEKLAQVASAR